MIGILIAAAALSAAPAPSAVQEHMKCAFQTAERLAPSEMGRLEIAESVVSSCGSNLGSKAGSVSLRESMRAAALAMVDRRRGTDGQPADAPFRLPNLETKTTTSRLDIPDEIAPAVIPYLGCLMARDGVQISSGPDPRPDGGTRGMNCAPYREEAARKADILLKQIGGRSAKQRAALIENTLSAADGFGKAPPPPPPPAAGKRTHAPN